jgi:hypothetical protein
MATTQTPDVGTAIATRKNALPAHQQAHVDEIRARNLMVAAIRGTQWGNNLSQDVQRSIAEYCRQNNLDPVRHVEILGGRIYLTAELYDEKGAHLIRTGVIRPDEPDYINADPRLDELEKKGDAWAAEENVRRLRQRIAHNVPEKAAAAVVQRFWVHGTDTAIVGVNWCGGTGKKDPVGDAEPAKTAATRARRRAWKQLADIIPGYAEIIQPIEATARMVSETMPVQVVEAPTGPKALPATSHESPYEAPIPPAQFSDDPAARAEDYEDRLPFGD